MKYIIMTNKLLDPGELFNTFMSGKEGMYEDVIDFAKEYGKQMYNAAIEEAANNAKVKSKWEFVLSMGDDDHPGETTYSVDKDSILKLKI